MNVNKKESVRDMEKDRQIEIDFIMDSLKFTWKQQPNLTFSELIRRVSPAVKSDVGTLYEVRKMKEVKTE